MRKYMSVGLVVAAVLATAVAPSFAAARSDPLAEFHSQRLTWSPCKQSLE